MEKFENFLFGTKLGYLTFFGTCGVIMWIIIALIFRLFGETLHFVPYMCGFMCIGLITVFTKYRDWPWFTPKDE